VRGTYSPGANASANRNLGGTTDSYGTFLIAEYVHFNKGISTFEDGVINSNLKDYWGTP
jgi:hypothetical protein